MSTFIVSPGVYTTEVNMSQLVPTIATTSAGIAFYSTQGDPNNVLLMTSSQQFIAEYGSTVLGNPGHYSALAYLQNGSALYCYRVQSGALYGGVNICEGAGVNGAISTGVAVSGAYPGYVGTSGSNHLFQIYGVDPGTWNNTLAVAIVTSSAIDPSLNAGAFDIFVYELINGTYTQVEKWMVSRQQQLDGYGRQQYMMTAINGFSSYICVADGPYPSTQMPNVNTAAGSCGTVTMNGSTVYLQALGQGSNGTSLLAEASGGTVGAQASYFTAGWNMFSNPSSIDIRLLIGAGQCDPTIQSYITNICNTRRDCMAILDMAPSATTSTTAMVTWRTTTQNINSTYGALYAPMVMDYDSNNDTNVFLPGSGYVASQFAYNDYVADVWYAPAGLNRGVLNCLSVVNQNGTRLVFAQADRDTLASNQINPLQVFTGSGNVIWGQKTLASTPSALDRVNVRRLLIIIEKVMSIALQQFCFEPNNDLTRFKVTAMLETYLDQLSAQGAFQTELGDKGYSVVCNDTNNTPAVIDNQTMVVWVFVKPSRAAEIIQLNVIVTPTGTAFNELIAQGTLL